MLPRGTTEFCSIREMPNRQLGFVNAAAFTAFRGPPIAYSASNRVIFARQRLTRAPATFFNSIGKFRDDIGYPFLARNALTNASGSSTSSSMRSVPFKR